jgi:hypothetical protein
MSSDVTADFVEIRGVFYKIYSKTDESGIRLYSFNNQKSWHHTMIDAFKIADEANELVEDGDNSSVPDEFNAWLISLVADISSLKPGETLRIIRDAEAVHVVRESISMSCRSELIDEVQLTLKET